MIRSMIVGVAALCLGASMPTLQAHDSEWPPAADPHNAATNPTPGSLLYMDEIPVTIPTEFRQWLIHWHQLGGNPTSVAFGDLEGENDGDLDVAIYSKDDALLIARLEIDWVAKTSVLTPLSFQLFDFALDSVNGLGGTSVGSHSGAQGRNIAVSDFDGDGRNEVALLATKWDTSPSWDPGKWSQSLYVLRHDEAAGTSPWGFSVPAPVVIDSTGTNISDGALGDRIGICRMRDTDIASDIVSHSHSGDTLGIWSLQGSQLIQLYEYDLWNGNTLGLVPPLNTTHEFNYVDVDGDGYDEFFIDGLVRFRDAAGPVNGLYGIQEWQTGIGAGTGHIDQFHCFDWDPSRPGLELLGNPESGQDTFFDPLDGTVISVNSDAPSNHGQEIVGGNFTATRAGFEAIIGPKDFSSPPQVVPPGEPVASGCYTISATQEELAVDGVLFGNQESMNKPLRRSTGPGWVVRPLDYDGDYTEDEILSVPWNTVIVWRMGEKGDWLPGPQPEGMPTQTEVEDVSIPPIDGTDYVFYYQGANGASANHWGWNNGGVGRYTHYFQKLGEVWPNSEVSRVYAYDLGGDHREELIATNGAGFSIFKNPAALGVAPRMSPSFSSDYRRWRMDEVTYPFDFQALPSIDRIEVLPKTSGMTLSSTKQLRAFAVLSDGARVNITKLVDWSSDVAGVSVSVSGLATSGSTVTCARIHATYNFGAGDIRSEPSYVLATNVPRPEVLLTGYGSSHLVEGDASRDLRVEARVAQRDDAPLVVGMFNSNGTLWQPFGSNVFLYDDGDPIHGDSEAGDGIYTVILSGIQDGPTIDPGDNLKVVKAIPQSTIGNPATASLPGEYVVIGGAFSFVGLTSDYSNDASPEEYLPRIRYCGTRGVDEAGRLVMDAEVLPPTTDLGLPIAVGAILPWSGTVVFFTDQGDHLHTLDVAIAGAPTGTHVVRVFAVIDYGAGLLGLSDGWPALRLH